MSTAMAAPESEIAQSREAIVDAFKALSRPTQNDIRQRRSLSRLLLAAVENSPNSASFDSTKPFLDWMNRPVVSLKGTPRYTENSLRLFLGDGSEPIAIAGQALSTVRSVAPHVFIELGFDAVLLSARAGKALGVPTQVQAGLMVEPDHLEVAVDRAAQTLDPHPYIEFQIDVHNKSFGEVMDFVKTVADIGGRFRLSGVTNQRVLSHFVNEIERLGVTRGDAFVGVALDEQFGKQLGSEDTVVRGTARKRLGGFLQVVDGAVLDVTLRGFDNPQSRVELLKVVDEFGHLSLDDVAISGADIGREVSARYASKVKLFAVDLLSGEVSSPGRSLNKQYGGFGVA